PELERLVDHDEQQLVVGHGLRDRGLEGQELGDAQVLPVGEIAALAFGLTRSRVADGASRAALFARSLPPGWCEPHRSANRNPIHSPRVISSGSARTPYRWKCRQRLLTSLARSADALGLERGSTACRRSMIVARPAHHRTLNGERSAWIRLRRRAVSTFHINRSKVARASDGVSSTLCN